MKPQDKKSCGRTDPGLPRGIPPMAPTSRWDDDRDRNTVYAVVRSSNGNLWRLERLDTYVSEIGRRARLAVLSTPCRVCGERFEVRVRAGIYALARTKSLEVVHCEAHRIRPGAPPGECENF